MGLSGHILQVLQCFKLALLDDITTNKLACIKIYFSVLGTFSSSAAEVTTSLIETSSPAPKWHAVSQINDFFLLRDKKAQYKGKTNHFRTTRRKTLHYIVIIEGPPFLVTEQGW